MSTESPRKVIGPGHDRSDWESDMPILYDNCPLQNADYDPSKKERICVGCGHYAACHALVNGMINLAPRLNSEHELVRNGDIEVDDMFPRSSIMSIFVNGVEMTQADWFEGDLEAGRVVVAESEK